MQLRGQYTVMIGGLVFGTLLVLGVSLLAEQRRYSVEIRAAANATLEGALTRQLENLGSSLVVSFADRLADALRREDHRMLDHEVADLRAYPGVVSVQLVDEDGVVLHDGSEANLRRGTAPRAAWVDKALGSGGPLVEQQLTTLRASIPVRDGDRLFGAAMLELSMAGVLRDMQVEAIHMNGLLRRQASSFSLTFAAVALTLLALSILAAIVVAGSLSRPIVDFAASARRIGLGERVRSPHTRTRDEIGDLARAFDEMAEALERTTVSKEWFDNVLRSMADMLVVTDAGGRIVTVNPSFLAEMGCEEEALRDRPISDLLPTLPDPAVPAGDGEAKSHFTLHRPDGATIPVRVAAAPLRDAAGAPAGRVLVLQNVVERLAAQRQIERSLEEKEILLREVHHRVKNNLQIISSMLNLQGDRTGDEQAREVFAESEIRIRAMALVHEQLYRSGDLAHVDLSSYLRTLAAQILRYFGRSDCRAEVRVDDAVRDVGVDQAIPIGLIVNELLSNAVRHGFAGGRTGVLEVVLREANGGRELMVRDDGLGIPGDVDPEARGTLGLKLVRALAGQLGATMSIERDSGTTFRLLLPANPSGEQHAPVVKADQADQADQAGEAGGAGRAGEAGRARAAGGTRKTNRNAA